MYFVIISGVVVKKYGFLGLEPHTCFMILDIQLYLGSCTGSSTELHMPTLKQDL